MELTAYVDTTESSVKQDYFLIGSVLAIIGMSVYSLQKRKASRSEQVKQPSAPQPRVVRQVKQEEQLDTTIKSLLKLRQMTSRDLLLYIQRDRPEITKRHINSCLYTMYSRGTLNQSVPYINAKSKAPRWSVR